MIHPDETPTPQGHDAAAQPEGGGSVFAQSAPQAAISETEAFNELENLYTEIAALKDRNLRTLADMENLRRRTDKEVADAKSYGVTSFARDMLPLADNLARALASFPEAERAALDPAARTFVHGVELTERDFHSRLARHGVKPIEPLGQKFDPNQHEALFELPAGDGPSGMVVQVVEAGFTIGDRVLRSAKVGVSKKA